MIIANAQPSIQTLNAFYAKDGYVFDWKDLSEHTHEDHETGEIIQEHLYAKTLFIGETDSIDNYTEVLMPQE